jgi:tetratricopeptide (TPR) repeat protein
MRRQIILILGSLLTIGTLSAEGGTRLILVAHDLENHPLSGFRFAYSGGGATSPPTNAAGATEVDLPPSLHPGDTIKILLLPDSKRTQDWFLVNSDVNIPTETHSAELVLMRRSVFRQIAEAARDAPVAITPTGRELSVEDRKRALVSAAASHGLTAAQLESAIRSFSEMPDPAERGIAAFLQGQYPQATQLLEAAAEKATGDYSATLLYLGTAQYQQARYLEASHSFRKALALRDNDAVVLRLLGDSLRKLAQWAEAEPLIRRALAIDVKSFGPDHPNVATDLNSLALLLQATNRLAEAEPLMRSALAIDEKRLGPDHPNVATDLNSLGLLLQATNRFAEAEPLMRRALAIDEKSFGPDHPNVATDLTSLASLLQTTNRLAEAEPLMRRALAIDKKSLGPDHPYVALALNNLASLLVWTNRLVEAEQVIRQALAIDERAYGPEHPRVAIRLNNLAQILKATNRLAEAEPLMRRALAIDEMSYGPQHPKVASDLNNLALLLKAIGRFAQAEALMRRALAIDEKSLGPQNLNVAIDANNLALLLQETDRLAEAEPLMRHALAIMLALSAETGHEQTQQKAALENYRQLLLAKGKSETEIDKIIDALIASSK